MSWKNHPWESIYSKNGRVLHEPFPGFGEVVRLFKESDCEFILDLGCGTGRHSIHLAKAGFSVLGGDISFSGLEHAAEWAQEEAVDIQLTQFDVRVKLPFLASMFDGVFSTQVIHHARLAQIQTAVKEIYRILKPGGLAFISVAAQKDEGCPFEEIEPGTFVPQTGSEAGLPHHIFTEESLRTKFLAFQVLEITRRAEGKVLALWAKKP